MGFKAKARKHMSNGNNKDDQKKKKSDQGELLCAIKGCEKFADKKLKGRSLSLDNALEMWGEGHFTCTKGRVRVCKSCYRTWKKENKSEDNY